jgi:hypothetical protein
MVNGKRGIVQSLGMFRLLAVYSHPDVIAKRTVAEHEETGQRRSNPFDNGGKYELPELHTETSELN